MMKSLGMEDSTMDDQVEDLRERMRMLQGDRKANVDLLESTKQANKEEIAHLRNENKDLRQNLAQMQRAENEQDENREVRHVQREVDHFRKQYDDIRAKVTRERRVLDKLRDEVRDLELEARRPTQEDNPMTRKIRMLENRLDKAMIKYNEAQSIRKTYEQIVKRLKEERVGFDNQLKALERTLAAKQRDFEELLLLSGDANHAREVAHNELERVRAGYEEERQRRDAELRERHQVVQLRKQMLERTQQREKMRREIVAKQTGDMNDEGEQQLKRAMAVNAMTQGKTAQDKVEQRSKIDVFENAFRKIKEATGVSDVNEVIQKIVSQEGTTESLMLLTRENQQKIEQLNEQKKQLKTRVEEIKYSGPGGGHKRKLVDDHEDQLAASAGRLERCRLKYDRLNKMLIAVKAGVGHLKDKLESVREEVGGREVDLSDETAGDALSECERMLSNIMKRTAAAVHEKEKMEEEAKDAQDEQDASKTSDSILGPAETPARPGSALSAKELSIMNSRPYNQRIDLPSMEDESEGFLHVDEEAGPDVEEDELTRDKVKRASAQILIQAERKKRPKRRKDAQRGGGGTPGGAGATGGALESPGRRGRR